MAVEVGRAEKCLTGFGECGEKICCGGGVCGDDCCETKCVSKYPEGKSSCSGNTGPRLCICEHDC